MTPAICKIKQANIRFWLHSYEHDPSETSFGKEAAEKLRVPLDRVFKTLVVSLDGRLKAVAVLPVSRQLDLKKFAKATGVKKAVMADKKSVEKLTGYILGGVSPIEQKTKSITIIDSVAEGMETVYVSAGKRGLQVELCPEDLRILTGGRFGVIGK